VQEIMHQAVRQMRAGSEFHVVGVDPRGNVFRIGPFSGDEQGFLEARVQLPPSALPSVGRTTGRLDYKCNLAGCLTQAAGTASDAVAVFTQSADVPANLVEVFPKAQGTRLNVVLIGQPVQQTQERLRALTAPGGGRVWTVTANQLADLAAGR
jgi:hypothetical protein